MENSFPSLKSSFSYYGRVLLRKLARSMRLKRQWRLLAGDVRRDTLKPRSHSHRVRPIVLRSGDGTRLRGWLMTPRWPEARGAVLYFGNGSEEAMWLAAQAPAMFPDMTILAMHYRPGAGKGKPAALEDMVADGEMLYDWLANSHRHLASFPIILMGRDFGAGVAVKVAASRPAAALALLTPREFMPAGWGRSWWRNGVVKGPAFLFERAAPAMVLRAQSDPVVPIKQIDAFVARLPPGTEDRTIAGADYHDLPYRPELHGAISYFLRERVTARPPVLALQTAAVKPKAKQERAPELALAG